MKIIHRITRVIYLMSAGVAIAIAIFPPALYSYLSYQNCSIALITEAEVLAPAFNGLIANPET